MKKLALLLVLFAFAACSDPEVGPLVIDGQPVIEGQSGFQNDDASESEKGEH